MQELPYFFFPLYLSLRALSYGSVYLTWGQLCPSSAQSRGFLETGLDCLGSIHLSTYRNLAEQKDKSHKDLRNALLSLTAASSAGI